MRIRSDSYYIEHGQKSVPPGWAGRWWRVVGVLVAGVTWVLAADGWEVALRFWAGLMAGTILTAMWWVAAKFDEEDKR